VLHLYEKLTEDGAKIMQSYFKAAGLPRTRPLSADEIIKLSKRLRSNILKYLNGSFSAARVPTHGGTLTHPT
jgi:hypothetical protein